MAETVVKIYGHSDDMAIVEDSLNRFTDEYYPGDAAEDTVKLFLEETSTGSGAFIVFTLVNPSVWALTVTMTDEDAPWPESWGMKVEAGNYTSILSLTVDEDNFRITQVD